VAIHIYMRANLNMIGAGLAREFAKVNELAFVSIPNNNTCILSE
jgi:hypothetical protein